MKGKFGVFLILAVLLLSIGAIFYFIMQFFEENPTQPQPTGYTTGVIIDIKDKTTILVVGGLSVEKAKSLSIQEAIDTGENATWFSTTLGQGSTLVLYDEVKVGYTTLSETYPAKGLAKTVEELNE